MYEYDPKKFNDSQVFDDLKEISIGSMDFDNPKVAIPPSPTVSFQYRKAYMPSIDAVTSNTTKYRLILTQYHQVPIFAVHSFITS